jgi:hypothetical protein
MKNLNQFGVVEINRSEASEINGGNFWTVLGTIVGYIAGAFVVGLFIDPTDYIN